MENLYNDLEIIKQIEKQIDVKLKELGSEEFRSFNTIRPGYLLDKNNRAIGLRIERTSNLIPTHLVKSLALLNQLVLRNVFIRNLLFLKELKKLTVLNLSGSRFRGDYSSLRELKGLTSLDLSGNKEIKDYSFLKELKGLTFLSLRYNNLSDITFLKELESLKRVDLGGNPIEKPPVEILSQGIKSIRDYFKSLEGEKQLLNELKVLLVGDGGAGKTSLLKQLKGKKFNENEPQTHGVNIEDLDLYFGGADAKIHIWDFGGQEIMHASHQFFLSKRSLYILVTDCRKDDKVEHWLKHIRSFGGNSPVMLVINKIDQNPSFDVNRQHLQEKYKNIRGFYRLSCASKKGLKEFWKEMIKQIETVEYMRTEWAKTWFDVKESLESMSENYITYERYYEICNQKNLTDKSQQKTLLEYLNNLGVILHFEDFELKEFQVLEPRWVTEAVYKIINSEKLAQKKGYLDKNMVDYILNMEPFNKDEFQASLKKTKYNAHEQLYIISLMKAFELCYSLADKKDMVLVPDLLEVREPQYVKTFDKKNALKFLYQFDFLPPSIIPRFIVKINRDIKAEDLQWRTGVVLEDKNINSAALIKADKEAKRIYIYVIGEQKRDYFSVIRHVLSGLIMAFEELIVTELVPLPDHEDIVIEYEELIGYEKARKDEYFIGKLNKAYSVSQLLNGIESPEDRIFKRPRDPSVHLDFKPNIEFKPEIHLSASAHAEARVESNLELSVDLPDLQIQFEDLKNLLEEKDPLLAKNLKEVNTLLYQLDEDKEKKELKGPLRKLGNLLKRLGDDKSEYSKLLKGTKKTLECAQKLGRTYDKFAQWIPGLPRIPDVFLGKKTK